MARHGRAGFTLLEAVLAVAIGAFLLTELAAVLRAARRIGDLGDREARRVGGRARAWELFRADFEARLGSFRVERSGGEVRLVFASTADGLGPGARRATKELRYLAGPEGLRRRDGDEEIVLSEGPVEIEFRAQGLWRKDFSGEPEAVRILLAEPSEEGVVLCW